MAFNFIPSSAMSSPVQQSVSSASTPVAVKASNAEAFMNFYREKDGYETTDGLSALTITITKYLFGEAVVRADKKIDERKYLSPEGKAKLKKQTREKNQKVLDLYQKYLDHPELSGKKCGKFVLFDPETGETIIELEANIRLNKVKSFVEVPDDND